MKQSLNSSDIFVLSSKVLSSEKGLRLAIIYGATAAGSMRSDSDVDLAVLFDHPLSADQKIHPQSDIFQMDGV